MNFAYGEVPIVWRASSGIISYFATQLKVLALVEVYKIISPEKHFHLCVERKTVDRALSPFLSIT